MDVGWPSTGSARRDNKVACFVSFHSTANWSGAPMIRRPSSRAIASVGSSHVRMVWWGSSRCASSRMRFHASFADSCIGTRKRKGFFQRREMLRAGCGNVNPDLTGRERWEGRERREREKLSCICFTKPYVPTQYLLSLLSFLALLSSLFLLLPVI